MLLQTVCLCVSLFGDSNRFDISSAILMICFLSLSQQIMGYRKRPIRQSVDTAQLHQSRLGLVSQAIMLIITVCFLLSEILGEFWKYKVPLESRNIFDVVFRIVELGVALWFPCVLWNCIR